MHCDASGRFVEGTERFEQVQSSVRKVRSSRIMRVCSIGAGRGSTRSHSVRPVRQGGRAVESPVGHDANPECIVIGGVRDVVDYMGYVTNLSCEELI